MSWFSKVSPMPAFPQYSGPYTVGSADLEIPVSSLQSPAPAPDADVTTVAFRIFYPCDEASRDRPIRWLAYPHRGYVQAFAQFLGASNIFAQLFS
ncbi:MAG: hypothetical protein INR71_02380 [Terriglobus roseus]|nr:hypothetical protein [Terriglobus roseus]